MKVQIFLLSLFSLLTSPALAASLAQCEFYSDYEPTKKMDCRFTREKGGAFTVSSLQENTPLYDDILVVSMAEGEVFGLTKAGVNSRWGSVKRDKDKACWKGSDFRICVRKRSKK